MNLNEFTSIDPIVEAQLVWARKGDKLTRKYRCGVGHRAGRVVSNPNQCNQPVNIKKQIVLKRTKARMGPRLSKKAQRTKKVNPASRALRKLNR
jgi:hypothetical protein